MKRLALLAFVAFGLHVQAQDMRGWVKTNPFGLFAGQFQCGYERAVSGQMTVQLTGGVVRSNLEFETDELETLLGIGTSLQAVDWSGFLIMPEVRLYLSEERGKGFYLGAFARARCIQRTMTTNFVSVQHRTAVGAGVVLGGQFNISKSVRGDLFIGPQIKSTTTVYIDHFVYGEGDWLPGVRFGMNFGWSP